MDISTFNIARLHPLLVHLPIGILVLTLLLISLKRKFGSPGYEFSIRIGLQASMITSTITVLTGLMLAQQNSYEQSTLTIHKWFGISTAFLSILLYLGHTGKIRIFKRLYPLTILLTIVAITVTGHFGGTLTHGPDYLFTFPKNDISKGEIFNPSAPVGHIVEIKQFKFVPQSLNVKLGDTITFINKDFVPHDITDLVNKSWSSGTLNSGDSWSLIPDVDINYYCSLHIIMKGKITIID